MPVLSTRAIGRGIRAGQTRAIARAISLVESRAPDSETILASLRGRLGQSHRIGLTGPPGVGKSTLIAQLAPCLKRPGRSLAILAIDPTSPLTGGAFLGDRVRMQSLVDDPRIFIRSMATRGAMNGLSRATKQAADLFDAARHDPILIETVGAGQADWAITRLVATTILVLTPGLGDTVQWLKAGLMELAHILVVNKADHVGAAALVAELRRLYGSNDSRRRSPERAKRVEGWTVPVIPTIAERGEGAADLAAAVHRHRAWLSAH